MNIPRTIASVAASTLVTSLIAALPASAGFIKPINFPVDGTVRYSDDFSDPRTGHQHEGNDLIGKKMMPLVSAVDGYVERLEMPQPSWGYAITLVDDEGWNYHYLHVNNDTPGTDDGKGGEQNAYAPDILAAYQSQGQDQYYGGRHGGGARVPVKKGQFIGWMGDSGNAEGVGAHLHFEIRMPDGTAINPYESLQAASAVGLFSPVSATTTAVDINTDRGIAVIANPFCVSGTRIKIASSKAVYYCGADGKRYVFPNDKTYYTWYPNFADVAVVSPEVLASIPLGGNVTYRPGVKMVKIQSDPKVYAVDRSGTLRWIESSEVAVGLYGVNWAKSVEDVSDAFFINYTVGSLVTRAK